MRKQLILLLFLLLFPCAHSISNVSALGGDPRIYVDQIFTNGNIISVDENNTIYQAIAITNNKISAVGTTEEILDKYRTEDLQFYDLEGKTMMPGFIDGHTHYMASHVWWGDGEPWYEMQELALANGFTTLNEKNIFHGELEELQQAELDGDLRVRLNLFLIYNFAFLNSNKETILCEYDTLPNPILDHEKMLRIPGMKIYVDGYNGDRGFPAMSEPYSSAMMNLWGIPAQYPYGNLYFNQTELSLATKQIQDRGFSVAFHAYGDRAIDTTLHAIQYALNGTLNNATRHQIEHNAYIREDLVSLAMDLDTIHSVRGYFSTYNQDAYEQLYPLNWQEWLVNKFSFPGVGLHSYLETDFSYPSYASSDWTRSPNIRPFLHLWGLVTRQAINSTGAIHQPHPWVAEHSIPVEQALRMMTYEGAYAVKQEEYVGTLEVGKFADVIILTADPLTIDPNNLKDIEVLLTMVGGKTEYKSESLVLISNSADEWPIFTISAFYPIWFIVGVLSVYSVRKKTQRRVNKENENR